MPDIYVVDLPPTILRRGFWLYAWRIVGPASEPLCYIGMTGDVNGSAQSPYVRAGAHLGGNRHANALRRRLAEHNIEPELCRSLRFAAYGPVYEYVAGEPRHAEHDEKRRATASLERRLFDEAKTVHKMLNDRPRGGNCDPIKWIEVRHAFARFLELGAAPAVME